MMRKLEDGGVRSLKSSKDDDISSDLVILSVRVHAQHADQQQ